MNESTDERLLMDPEVVEFAAKVQKKQARAVRLAPRPSPEDLQKEVSESTSAIFLTHEKLGKVFQWYGETIGKRWLKKSMKQRRELLLAAWPEMPLYHRPDLRELLRYRPGGLGLSTIALLWPYINLEDLLRDEKLVQFISSRATHPPSMFAHADLDSCLLGLELGALIPPILDGHTMLLNGDTSDTYGKIVAWADDNTAQSLLTHGVGFHPGKGHTVVKIQCKTLNFLLDCCEKILHDHLTPAGEIMFKGRPASFITTEMKAPNELPSLSSIASEAPYRVPAHLNLSCLKALAVSKRGDAEDHIWALREDPGYFMEMLGEVQEHRQEHLFDHDGYYDPSCIKTSTFIWDISATVVTVEAYSSYSCWDVISREIERLCELNNKYAASISPQQSLPKELLLSFLVTSTILYSTSECLRIQLFENLFASPSFRSSYVRIEKDDATHVVERCSEEEGGTDYLLDILTEIADNKLIRYVRLPMLMDQLQHSLKDPQQKARLTPRLSRIISDIGLIAQFRAQLDLYHPWAATMEHDLLVHEEEVVLYQQATYGLVARLVELEMTFCTERTSLGSEVHSSTGSVHLATLVTPLKEKFYYPSNKRTIQSTARMQESEANLDKFWATMDSCVRNETGTSIFQTCSQGFSRSGALERTPDWVDVPKAARPTSLQREVSSKMEYEIPLRENNSAEEVARKTKVKTRGTAKPELVSSIRPTEPKGQAVEPPIKLSKRAFKVFSVLFFVPNASNNPGEVSWQDFIFAMVAAGFSAQKLYGSIWQFKPLAEMGTESSIQFHEPHPHDKLDFRAARRIGRRLFRTYGLHIGRFEFR